MWSNKERSDQKKLYHRNNRSKASIKKENRELTEMVQAWNKNGRRAHSENSTDDRHTTKKAEMTTKDHMKDVCKRREHCESQCHLSHTSSSSSSLSCGVASCSIQYRQKTGQHGGRQSTSTPATPHEREEEDDEVCDRWHCLTKGTITPCHITRDTSLMSSRVHWL